MIFNKNDMIYVCDEHNRYAKKVLVCIESTSIKATFVPLDTMTEKRVANTYTPIYLGQHQESLDNIKGIVITRTDDPEYFI